MPVKNESKEGRERRLRAFRHNSYGGFCVMMHRHCLTIINSDSASQQAKDTAASIMALAHDLQQELKTRVDD